MLISIENFTQGSSFSILKECECALLLLLQFFTPDIIKPLPNVICIDYEVTNFAILFFYISSSKPEGRDPGWLKSSRI